jgi:hypothetical protein
MCRNVNIGSILIALTSSSTAILSAHISDTNLFIFLVQMVQEPSSSVHQIDQTVLARIILVMALDGHRKVTYTCSWSKYADVSKRKKYNIQFTL